VQPHGGVGVRRFLSADSAIVTVDAPDAEAKLTAAGVRAAVRGGRVPASFHVYSTEADVEMALNALVG
jgi:hypothetical protein